MTDYFMLSNLLINLDIKQSVFGLFYMKFNKIVIPKDLLALTNYFSVKFTINKTVTLFNKEIFHI